MVTAARVPPPLRCGGLARLDSHRVAPAIVIAAISSRNVTATYLYCIVKSATKPSTARCPEGSARRRTSAGCGCEPIAVADCRGRSRWRPTVPSPRTPAVGHGLGRQRCARPRERRRALCDAGRHDGHPDEAFHDVFERGSRRRRHRPRKEPIAAAMRRIAGAEEWGVRILREPCRDRRKASRRQSRVRRSVSRRQEEGEGRCEVVEAGGGGGGRSTSSTSLATIARDARRRDDAPAAGATPPLLDAAFLVPAASRARFKSAATRGAARCAGAGAQMMLSGPWPAYNFVQAEEER